MMPKLAKTNNVIPFVTGILCCATVNSPHTISTHYQYYTDPILLSLYNVQNLKK